MLLVGEFFGHADSDEIGVIVGIKEEIDLAVELERVVDCDHTEMKIRLVETKDFEAKVGKSFNRSSGGIEVGIGTKIIMANGGIELREHF